MYTTGTICDYEKRLHECPTTVADIDLFLTEGRGYLTTAFTTVSGVYKSGVLPSVSGNWEKELRLQKYHVTASGLVLSEQQL